MQILLLVALLFYAATFAWGYRNTSKRKMTGGVQEKGIKIHLYLAGAT